MSLNTMEREESMEGVRIRVWGDIDSNSFLCIEKAILDDLYKGVRLLELDLSGVRHFTSAAAGMLINARSVAQDNGSEFAVLNPSQSVRMVLQILGLEGIFGLESVSNG